MDFIKNKIVLRTILGSIVPFIGLLLAHLVQKLSSGQFLNTTPNYALIVTIAFSIWPLNYLSLFIFFYVIESWIDRKIRVENPEKKYPTLLGTYAPV